MTDILHGLWPAAHSEVARGLPRGVALRRGSAQDEFATFEVMRRAMGYEMSWTHHAPVRHHMRASRNCSFWLAEEAARFGASRVVGYARSLVRDRVWMLTEFFVQPGHHRQGIGGMLLDRCLQDGRDAGADTFLVLASHHPGADSLYIRKAGCLPQTPMILLAGPLTGLTLDESPVKIYEAGASPPTVPGSGTNSTRRPGDGGPAMRVGHDPGLLPSGGQPATVLRAEPLRPAPEVLDELDALDRQIVGYARRSEHLFWMREMGGVEGASRLFREGVTASDPGRLAGYVYLGAAMNGPALGLSADYLPPMLAYVAAGWRQPTLFHRSSTSQHDHYLALAGTNGPTLRWLLACGWQIAFQYLFMCNRPLGQPDRYIGHSPLYFL